MALHLCYRTYINISVVGRPYGVPLPPEAPYPIHQPQDKSGCQILVDVQVLAYHLEVNCQYKMFGIVCIIVQIMHIIYHLVQRGAIHNKTAVRGGGGRPPRPPEAPPLLVVI